MASHDTLFTSDPGSASNTAQYVKDVFDDVTLPANSNNGLTSSASTNPLGDQFANDDCPKFGRKTLYIKDLVLVDDRSKWVSGKPTYRIIWNETFPGIGGYVFGEFSSARTNGQVILTFKAVGDGIGINGVVRRVGFVVQGVSAATATGQIVVDGSNTTTVDFSNVSSYSTDAGVNRFMVLAHSTTNETNDLHDIRLTAIQSSSTLLVAGVSVYFDNGGGNVVASPGNSYVNKSLVTTSTGATFSSPTFGSSMGGKALVYKTSSSGYAMSNVSASTIISISQGSSGTNLLNVSTGHGASFPVGAGVVTWNGTTMYVGAVTNVSTDTLTVSPTLTLGVSNTIYRSWLGGQSLAINASLMAIAFSVNSSPVLDPNGRYAVYGSNLGYTTIDGVNALCFLGASGYLQVDGRFSAADIEYVGSAIHGATYYVNGLPAWNIQSGQTGAIKKTVFTDAGLGWNSFQVVPSASMGFIGIAKINLYQRNRDLGVSFGMLGEFETNQTWTDRGAVNATIMSLGTERRVYADYIPFLGASAWIRATNMAAPGLAQYLGFTTTASFSFQYYGKNFAIIGITTASGATLKLDGVGFPNTFNVAQGVATEGFHTITYQVNNGNTAVIQAIDIGAINSGVKFLSKTAKDYTQTLNANPSTAPTVQVITSGSGTYQTPPRAKYLKIKMVGAGGGGGGSGASGGGATGGNAGGNTSFGTLLANGGQPGLAGGGGGGVGGAGGTAVIGSGATGIALTGGAGGTGPGENVADGASQTILGPPGGASPFGGAGAGGGASAVGGSGATNSGSGGGGTATASTNGNNGGGGSGGAGGYIEAMVPIPSSSYAYSIGIAGSNGQNGTNGQNGGSGGSGVIIVEEYYV